MRLCNEGITCNGMPLHMKNPAQGMTRTNVVRLATTMAQENQAATRVTCGAKGRSRGTFGYPKRYQPVTPNAGYEPKGSLLLTQWTWTYAKDVEMLLMGSMW